MPEPEFFFIQFVAGAVFVFCCAIAFTLFIWGRKKKSTPLKISASIPLLCGLVVYAPILALLLSWIWFWAFGDKTIASTPAPSKPPALVKISDATQSSSDDDIPDTKDFKPLLIRDLTEHFRPEFGKGITVDYELLRDVPTQTGIAYPKYYLWVTVTKPDKTIVDGAARVAAIDVKQFQVTDFLARGDIIAKPDAIARVFPKLLLDKIRKKAGLTP